MQTLQSLTDDAKALANGLPVAAAKSPAKVIPIQAISAEAEVARALQICNACRYCEGFCAVFPAMTRRLEFGTADVHYLANLCHNCGACLHACQYAPPHEFAVNIPKAMAEVRGKTYADYAWPPALGSLYQRNGLAALWGADLGGNFYRLFPHNLLVGLFAPVFLFVVLALSMGVRRFWKDVKPATSGADVSAPAATEAAHDVLRLKYLDGGHGDGCHNEDDAYTLKRRRAHHLTFYGFLLCFAATSLATVYHYVFGWPAPYEAPSIPKLLGVAGGVMLVLGTIGLWYLNRTRHPAHGDAAQKPMDLGFIALLFLVAASGLALWLVRITPSAAPALALVLCLHLGAVMALFATLPYGKFAHGVFRTAALLRHTTEKRQPNPIGLGSD